MYAMSGVQPSVMIAALGWSSAEMLGKYTNIKAKHVVQAFQNYHHVATEPAPETPALASGGNE